MFFKSLRDRAQWITLGSAGILFSMDMYCRLSGCYDWRTGTDRTPTGLMPAWLLLIPLTFLLAIISIPRWPAFVAIVILGWIVFLSIGSDWPMQSHWFEWLFH